MLIQSFLFFCVSFVGELHNVTRNHYMFKTLWVKKSGRVSAHASYQRHVSRRQLTKKNYSVCYKSTTVLR